jgi:uncharacterized membrane protein
MWIFTPAETGIYYVYLKITDTSSNTVQSATARIVVTSTPVGGYSVSSNRQLPTTHMATYVGLIALFAAILSLKNAKENKIPSTSSSLKVLL